MKEAIIIDEASMLDLFPVERPIEFCTLRTKLILVGDVDQLNRVGQGQVFRDPLESGEVPVIRILQCRKDKKMEETGTLETIKALLLN